MEKQISEISINLTEKSFVIRGSEEFIERNQEKLKEFVIENSVIQSIIPETKMMTTAMDSVKEEKTADKYILGGIYSVDEEDGTVTLLKRIPGRSNSEKTKNIALIVLYAKNERIRGSEIRGLCEKQKCYDSKNFAGVFKRDLENFILKGKGQAWTLELSIPGRENAEKLLESMLNEKSNN